MIKALIMKKQKKFKRIITTLLSFQKQYIKKQRNIMKITKKGYNNKHKNCYRRLPENKKKKKKITEEMHMRNIPTKDK